MSERLCFECFINRQPSQNGRPEGYHLSTTAEICAGCGQKQVVVTGVASEVESWRWAKEIEKQDRLRDGPMTVEGARDFIELYTDTVENITLGYIQEPSGIAIQWKVKCIDFGPNVGWSSGLRPHLSNSPISMRPMSPTRERWNSGSWNG